MEKRGEKERERVSEREKRKRGIEKRRRKRESALRSGGREKSRRRRKTVNTDFAKGLRIRGNRRRKEGRKKKRKRERKEKASSHFDRWLCVVRCCRY